MITITPRHLQSVQLSCTPDRLRSSRYPHCPGTTPLHDGLAGVGTSWPFPSLRCRGRRGGPVVAVSITACALARATALDCAALTLRSPSVPLSISQSLDRPQKSTLRFGPQPQPQPQDWCRPRHLLPQNSGICSALNIYRSLAVDPDQIECW